MKMKGKLSIPSGGMYQEWDHLIDLLEKEKATELEALALNNGWRVIGPDEAKDMGFIELVDWSISETDVLVLIDNNYLVCIPKKLYCAVEC